MQFPSLVLLVILQKSAAKMDSGPVFLLDYDNKMNHLVMLPNPFATISSSVLTNVANEAAAKSQCVIIFVENTLSVEDISTRDYMGTPYFNLQKGLAERKVIYMPSVNKPFDTLKEIFKPRPHSVYYLGPGKKLHMADTEKYLYIYFQDDSESRTAKLRKHDSIIREVYQAVRQLKPGPVIGFYTGKINPITIEEQYDSGKSHDNANFDPAVVLFTNDARYRLVGLFAKTPSRRTSFDQTPTVEEETRTSRDLSTTMQFTDFQLKFNFEFGEKTWRLVNVALLEAGEEVGRTDMGVGAPWHWSYFCAEPFTVLNERDGSSITVSEYQIQPVFRGHGNEESSRCGNSTRSCGFDVAVNCGPYFNSQILAGLLVTLIVLVITTFGVVSLYNCEGNSRFDDPNQKPLVIAVEAGGGGL